ncbi:MAG: ATP-dependent Clp protease ATP-binding subunit [Bacteroidales bacterium]
MKLKITEELSSTIRYSRDEAMRTGCYSIEPDHLLLGMIRQNNNEAIRLLTRLNVNLTDMKYFISIHISAQEPVPFKELDSIAFSPKTQKMLSAMMEVAFKFNNDKVNTIHLLVALENDETGYGRIFLRSYGIDKDSLLSELRLTDEESYSEKTEGDEDEDKEVEPEKAVPEKELSEHDKILAYLEKFGRNLTKAAADGEFDRIVGRDDEIQRVIEILGRKKKNNPMLIGEPGVGKSAIVEGLALKIAKGEITGSFAKKTIVSLDLASVIAGTKYRGDFEKRLKTIIDVIRKDSDIIIFIDEIHNVIGAGSVQGGNMDAADMLKPSLARGEFQCIGATTMDEFSKIVEKDGAFDRRFQTVVVRPSSVKETIDILNTLSSSYGDFHKVHYEKEALEACVRLTDRFVPDKFLPDKAIDVMDEAGSMAKLRRQGDSSDNPSVTINDIASLVSKMTGIPVNRIEQSEADKLMGMRDKLKSRIIGQDEAVDIVTRAIQRNRAGLKNPERPICSFIFFGPTGVGKTYLAKCLADLMFGSQENMVRIDMSEYGEKFSVSRLIGAPPGYVGYEEGGQLSEKVRRKPYCVILLDEIEKAHPDIFNLLLQVLDDGRITDGNGRTVSFKNTIIIMTSNVGSSDLEQFGGGLGFSTAGKDDDKNKKNIISKAIKKTFPPEFVNRVDEQVFFNSLTKNDISEIVKINLESLKKRVKDAGFSLNVSKKAVDYVTDSGFDRKFGARPVARAITRYIEDPVSEFIINNSIAGYSSEKKPTTIKIDLSPEKDKTIVKV